MFRSEAGGGMPEPALEITISKESSKKKSRGNCSTRHYNAIIFCSLYSIIIIWTYLILWSLASICRGIVLGYDVLYVVASALSISPEIEKFKTDENQRQWSNDWLLPIKDWKHVWAPNNAHLGISLLTNSQQTSNPDHPIDNAAHRRPPVPILCYGCAVSSCPKNDGRPNPAACLFLLWCFMVWWAWLSTICSDKIVDEPKDSNSKQHYKYHQRQQ